MTISANIWHETGHITYALGHDLAIQSVFPECTQLAAPLPTTNVQLALGALLAGEAALSHIEGRPFKFLDQSCYEDANCVGDLLRGEARPGRALDQAIRHVQHYFARPAVWSCILHIARVLHHHGGYMSGPEIAALASFHGLPYCNCAHLRAELERPLAPRRMADTPTPGDVMHEVYQRHEHWRPALCACGQPIREQWTPPGLCGRCTVARLCVA
jgi:hypothetical protein